VSRWAATSNVEMGQTTYAPLTGKDIARRGKEARDNVTKDEDKRRKWNSGCGSEALSLEWRRGA